jgi:hypothetical protein
MKRWLYVALGVACAAAGVFTIAFLLDDSSSENPSTDTPRTETSETAEPEWDFVVPAGTSARLAAGEEIDIMPAEVRARVGESIRIENRDDAPFMVGPWYVGPGETMQQRFVSPGEFKGDCSLQVSGELRVIVTA